MSEVILDVERQKKAKQYARIQRRWMLVDPALGGAYAVAWLVFGWSAALKAALLHVTTTDWLPVALYGAVFGLGYVVVDLPLSYYTGFVLPHRFEIATQTLKTWIADQVKGLMLGAILGGLIVEVIYAVLRAAPDTWWLWAAAILLLFQVILVNLAPVLIFPLFFKFQPLGDEHAELSDRLIRVAERAHAHVRGVYKFDMSRRTKQANAALTGLGNTRRIILGDTLLNEFTPDEIETILAHELGHHVHKDIPIGIAVETAMTLAGLYLASLGLRWGVQAFGFAGPADIAALPVFALIIGAYGLLTLPLSNGFSRWRERRADKYALESTDKGAAYASALIRLANQNLADADPARWEEVLLHSHPALSKRIAMARAAAPSQSRV